MKKKLTETKVQAVRSLAVAKKLHVLSLDRAFAFEYRKVCARDFQSLRPIKDVVAGFLRLEEEILGKDSTGWFANTEKALSLRLSMDELYQIQKEVSKRVKSCFIDRQARPTRDILISRVQRLVGVVEGAYRRMGHRIDLIPYFTISKLATSKRFEQLAKFDALLLALGFRRQQEVRMYVDGVLDARTKKYTPTVRDLASPMSVFDYLAWFRRHWREQYPSSVDQDAAKQELFRPYHQQCADEALAFTKSVIAESDPDVDSRLGLEIPQALAPYPMMIYYAYGSSHVRWLEKSGILHGRWPEVWIGLNRLRQEAESDVRVKRLLERLERRINEFWEKSGTPDTRQGDKQRLLALYGL